MTDRIPTYTPVEFDALVAIPDEDTSPLAVAFREARASGSPTTARAAYDAWAWRNRRDHMHKVRR